MTSPGSQNVFLLEMFESVVFKLEPASASPGSLLRACISNKFPGKAAAAGPESTL